MRKGDFNIVRIQTGLANGDPFGLLYTFIMPDGALNISNSLGYNNPEVTELMNRVKHITDEQERQRIFDRVQEIVAYEQPVIPLFNDMNIVAYNKRLKNYKPLIYGVDLSKVELAEWNESINKISAEPSCSSNTVTTIFQRKFPASLSVNKYAKTKENSVDPLRSILI